MNDLVNKTLLEAEKIKKEQDIEKYYLITKKNPFNADALSQTFKRLRIID